MSVSSKTEILNSALRKLGAEAILTAEDASTRARLTSASYDIKLPELIRSHPWNRFISYVELAAVDPTPSDVYDYSYVFQLPEDCLRVLDTSLGSRSPWEEIEGKRIACDESEITVKYIKFVEDVSKFDANFVEALAWMIAEDCAYSITQSTAQVEVCGKKAKEALRMARSYDAQVGSVKVVEANEWLDSRRY